MKFILKSLSFRLLIAALCMMFLISMTASAVEVKRIEETDSSFIWGGLWQSEQNPGASGGSWKVTTYMPSETNDVSITFTGTRVKLVSITCDHCGIMKINIDGKSYPDIDMYSKETNRFNMYIATDLPNIQHTLTLSVSDTKNPASTGNNICVDAIEVTAPTPATTSDTSGQPSKSASVSLHGEKTDVVLGEDILLKLSAVNLITKPKMHVQVIIIPPSGMSVTSSEFSKSGAGQFTANYELEPGDGKDVEVRIKSNQVGDFNVNGRVVYYFGDEKDKAEDYNLNLPIKVRTERIDSAQNGQKMLPGFASMFAIAGILAVAYLLRCRK